MIRVRLAIILLGSLLGGCHGAQFHSESRKNARERWEVTRADVKAGVGRAELAAGRLDSAARELAAAREINPTDSELALLDAQIALSRGDTPRAEALLRTLMTDDKLSPRAAYLLGALLQQRGDHSAAAQAFDEATRLDPLDADALSAAVQCALQRGDVSRAHQLVRASPAELRSLPAYHALVAEIAEHDHDWTAAVAAWRTVAAAVQDEQSWLRLAGAAHRAQRWDESLAALQAAISGAAREPTPAEQLRMARCRFRLNQLEPARLEAVRAYQSDPQSLEAGKLLLEILLASEDTAAAREIAERLHPRHRADVEILGALTLLCALDGDGDLARNYATTLTRLPGPEAKLMADRALALLSSP